MIKSTKSSLKFTNTGKRGRLNEFIAEYRRVVSGFVDILWTENKVSLFIPKETTSKIDTWLSARAIQCAGKQASGIVRGTKKKQEKRLWKINDFNKKGMFKRARELQAIYDYVTVSKPSINNVEPELDSRFVKIDLDNETSFDGWLSLSSLGNKIHLTIPFKKHRHFNKMLDKGVLKSGIRLGKSVVTFMFDIPDPVSETGDKTLGVDIGQTSTLSCSDGQQIGADSHGHTFRTISESLARKQKGSKSFGRKVTHRTNFINWSINQLNLSGIGRVNIEDIKNMYKGRNMPRVMKHWNYAELFDKLESKVSDAGVQIEKRSPTYTSQRCSRCGWVRKANRKGKVFKCTSCGFTHDADLNASLNLSLNLLPIGKRERLLRKNIAGFYWRVVGQEPIVPDAPETQELASV